MEISKLRLAQLILALLLVAFAIRTMLIFRERSTGPIKQVQTESGPMDADNYVVPHKIYAFDLKSAREALVSKTVWVKAGYGVAFYPFDTDTKRSDFGHEAGLLAPVEQLEIKDVVLDRSPGSVGQWQGPPGARFRIHADEQQVMAVFAKDGKSYAFPIGVNSNGNYHFIADDLLFTQDPHQLYKHWPQATWQAIDQHQPKPGMNQLQVSFAIGVPDSASSLSSTEDTTLHYANNGHPLYVTFVSGRVAEIKPQQAGAAGGGQ